MDSMLVLSESLPGVQKLVLLVLYLIGFGMVGVGLAQMATAGDNRGHYSHGAGLGFTLILTGSLLTALLGTARMLMATFYNGGNVSPEVVLASVSGANGTNAWVKVIFNILIILGWISLGRGLLILGIAGSRRDKGLASGLVHVITGALLTNPVAFAQMAGVTLGQLQTVNLFLPQP